MRPLLGTFVEIGTFDDSPQNEAAITSAFSRIQEVHEKLSCHNPDSELSKLNSHPGEEIALSPVSASVLRLAKYMTNQTQGSFNFTSGGKLIRLGKIPQFQKHSVLEFGWADDLKIQGNKALLRRPVHITVDGIAKGFAVDLAIKELKNAGLNTGWVNAGGDLRVFGENDLPIHRREKGNRIKLLGTLKNSALATSSVDEKFDDRFPGHICSEAGPLNYGIWSVKAPFAWLADALTKVAAVMPAQKRDRAFQLFGAELI